MLDATIVTARCSRSNIAGDVTKGATDNCLTHNSTGSICSVLQRGGTLSEAKCVKLSTSRLGNVATR